MPAPPSSAKDEAVSPVVGTIVLVAIAVVLAGGLFVVASQIGKDRDAPPDMAFRRDEQADRLQIVKVEPGVFRSEYDIRMTVHGDFNVDGPIQAGDDVAVANAFVRMAETTGAPADGQLTPGSYIAFCAETGALGPNGGGGPAAPDVLVELRHRESNSVVWHDTFLTMADCPT